MSPVNPITQAVLNNLSIKSSLASGVNLTSDTIGGGIQIANSSSPVSGAIGGAPYNGVTTLLTTVEGLKTGTVTFTTGQSTFVTPVADGTVYYPDGNSGGFSTGDIPYSNIPDGIGGYGSGNGFGPTYGPVAVPSIFVPQQLAPTWITIPSTPDLESLEEGYHDIKGGKIFIKKIKITEQQVEQALEEELGHPASDEEKKQLYHDLEQLTASEERAV